MNIQFIAGFLSASILLLISKLIAFYWLKKTKI